MKPEMIIYDDQSGLCNFLWGEELFPQIGRYPRNIIQGEAIPMLEREGYKLFMITHIEDGVNRWYWKLENKEED